MQTHILIFIIPFSAFKEHLMDLLQLIIVFGIDHLAPLVRIALVAPRKVVAVVLSYIVILSTLENKAVSAARCLGPVGSAALS